MKDWNDMMAREELCWSVRQAVIERRRKTGIEVSRMKAWRKYNGTFLKENDHTPDKFFNWVNWDAGAPFITGHLRMIARARARKIAGNRLNEARA